MSLMVIRTGRQQGNGRWIRAPYVLRVGHQAAWVKRLDIPCIVKNYCNVIVASNLREPLLKQV